MEERFFTHNRGFYKTFFGMMLVLTLQNLVAYSVNMADNLMLGSYSQNALSGAATVNQIFFMVQQFALAFGNALVVLASQYWGENRKEPIRVLTGIALKAGLFCGIVIVVLCTVMPKQLLGLFTNAPEIINQGLGYLDLLKWTFAFYIITNILMAALRSVEIVNISFYISVVSLIINVAINYTLIFGRFGMPEMGIMGAAIGTLVARILELVIVVIYIIKDKKIELFKQKLLQSDDSLRKDYMKAAMPIILAQILWGVSVPMQTAILGHLSDDAIAANSVATTFYQYLKVIVIAMTSASAVMMGNGVGRGNMKRIRCGCRNCSGNYTVCFEKSITFHVSVIRRSTAAGRSSDCDYEFCHGGDVLSDAGQCRDYSGWWRYEVQYGDEYDQYVGDCHAIILCGSILVEAAGRTGRHRDSVGSVL